MLLFQDTTKKKFDCDNEKRQKRTINEALDLINFVFYFANRNISMLWNTFQLNVYTEGKPDLRQFVIGLSKFCSKDPGYTRHTGGVVGHVFHFDFKYEMKHLNIIRMFDFLDLRKAFDAVYSGKIKVLYKWNVL